MMTGSLRVEVLTDLGAAERLAPSWDTLAVECGARGTAGAAYCLAWWRHLGQGRLLVIAAFDSSGRLIALGPFHERRIAGSRVVRFLGHGMGQVSELLVAPGRDDAADAIWASLAKSPQPILQLTDYRYGGGGLLALRRAAEWDTRLEIQDLCPVLSVDQSLETLLEGRDHRTVRRTLSVAERNLKSEGLSHEVEVVTVWDALVKRLDDLDAIFEVVERGKGRLNVLSSTTRGFTLELLEREAKAGRLAVFISMIGGHPAGIVLALRTGPCLAYWVPRFNPIYERFRPGHLLLREVVAYACRDDMLRELDLLLGDHEYKRRWTSTSYDTLRVEAAAYGRLPPARALLRSVEQIHRLRQRFQRRSHGAAPRRSRLRGRLHSASPWSAR